MFVAKLKGGMVGDVMPCWYVGILEGTNISQGTSKAAKERGS